MQPTNYLTLHSSRLATLQTSTLSLSTLTGSTIRASFLTLSTLTVSSINGALPGTGSGAGSFSTSVVAGAVYYSAGNVGIGSASPGFRLVVDNGSSAGINTVIQASGITAGTNTSLLLGKALSANNCGTILWNHIADGSATNYMGLGYHGADNRLNITCSGSVGIGITNPGVGYALHVNGAIFATGDITAFSDQRYKQNIIRLDRSLDLIRSLRGYSYTREDYRPGERQIGLLAQEVKAVLPEAVSYDSTNDIYSVNYNCLMAPVVESIKELSDRVEAQQSVMEAQQSVIDTQQLVIQKLLDRLGPE